MAGARNFRDYPVWNEAVDYATYVYEVTGQMPWFEKKGLCDQLQRAAVSIISNIAEGAARSSDADFAHFLDFALGSAFEVETQLKIAKNVGYFDNLDVDNRNDNLNLNVNESYAYKAIDEFWMVKFAKGLMWIMQKALGMPREWMLWEPDEKEGRYILEQVMAGGNFGHHDERLKHSGGKLGAVKAILTHNLHLITHYPSDVIWAPVWIVWHKLWKMWIQFKGLNVQGV